MFRAVRHRPTELAATLRRPALAPSATGSMAAAILIGCLCLALVGIEVWRACSARSAQLAASQVAAVNLAESAAQHANGAFEVADTILTGLVERIEADGVTPPSLQRLRRVIARRMAELPLLADIILVGEEGEPLTATSADDPAPTDSGQAELIAYHRQHAAPGAHVGQIRRNPGDGRMVVTLSRRFDHPDGRFAGAIVAAIDLNYFLDFYRTLSVGEHGVVSLWRADGTLLVRQPPAPGLVGHNLTAIDALERQAFAAGNGVFVKNSSIDGQHRLYAYQHLKRFPLVLFNGISTQDALAEWRVETEMHAAGLALFVAVIGLAGWRVLRLIASTRKAEGAFRLLADHCADVIFTLDLRYRVQYVTPSVLDCTGLAPESLIGTALMRHVHPDDRAPMAAIYQAVAGGQERALVRHRIRHADGRMLWMEVKLRLVRDELTGAPVGMIGAARDVTAHQAAEDSLLAEQAFFQALFEHTTDCLFVQRVLPDGSFAIERINSAAANSLGIAARDAVGRSPHNLFGEAYGEVVDAGLRNTLAARQALWMEDRGADGITWEVIEVPIPGPSGAIERILVNARDVTEQKRVQEAELLLRASEEQRRLAAEATSERHRAEQANQAKSRCLTGMSHELRTPLNGILGYAQLLRMEGGLRPTQAGHVEAMLAAGRHLLDMITSVLDMGQIEADKITLQSAEVNLPDLAHACLGLVRPVAESKGLDLSFTAAADAPVDLRADPLRLRQVLLNLLGNAVKFTNAGSVSVRLLWSEGRAVRMEVADTGPGIPPMQRDRLFEAFERMDDPDTAATEGAGLGLAISARLVTAMGGRIGCDAGPNNVGSIFWFELPALRVATDPAAIAQIAPVTGTPLRLLVVDDIANNREIASAFLRSAGHEVTNAAGGEAAVRAAATEEFDVILMDVRMPGVDGLEATRRIRALPGARGQVPIIAVTAQAFAEQIDKCRVAGMDHHLAKPFEIEALLDAVAAAGMGRPARSPALATAPEIAVVLNRAIFEDTAAYLPATELDQHLRGLMARGRALLAALQGEAAIIEAAELAHAMAGAAGTFGFQRVAELGRRFEYAAETGAAELAELAASLADATQMTIAALDRILETPAAA